MTNRIQLSAGGLKVSKPGYDVTTCGQIGLSFDSAYNKLAMQSITGTVSVPANGSATVNYSYATAPLVFFQYSIGGTMYGGGYVFTSYQNAIGGGNFRGGQSGTTKGMSINLASNGFTLLNWSPSTAYTARYVVLTLKG